VCPGGGLLGGLPRRGRHAATAGSRKRSCRSPGKCEQLAGMLRCARGADCGWGALCGAGAQRCEAALAGRRAAGCGPDGPGGAVCRGGQVGGPEPRRSSGLAWGKCGTLAGCLSLVAADGSWQLAAGGWRLAAGGWRLAAGGWRLAAGGWWLVAGGRWLQHNCLALLPSGRSHATDLKPQAAGRGPQGRDRAAARRRAALEARDYSQLFEVMNKNFGLRRWALPGSPAEALALVLWRCNLWRCFDARRGSTGDDPGGSCGCQLESPRAVP
jgi:hypothetical protein